MEYQWSPQFGSADEIFVGVLKRYFAGQAIEVATIYQEGMTLPMVETRRERRSGTMGLGTKDERFLRSAVMVVNCLVSGINAEQEAEQLSEACYNALLEAMVNQIVIPGKGHISDIKNSSTIASEPDWATSTGSVQYAQLPKGTVRYETIYRVLFRPPRGGANNPFIPRP